MERYDAFNGDKKTNEFNIGFLLCQDILKNINILIDIIPLLEEKDLLDNLEDLKKEYEKHLEYLEFYDIIEGE